MVSGLTKIKLKYILSFTVVCIATVINVYTYNIRFGDGYTFSDEAYFSKPETIKEARYYLMAESISKGRGKYMFDGYEKIKTERDIGRIAVPGYAALISWTFLFSGSKVQVIIIFQILLHILACLLLFRIGITWLNKWVAFLLTLSFMVYTEVNMHNLVIVRDAISVSILIFSFYFLSKYFNKAKCTDLYLYTLISIILIAINARFIVHFGLIMLLILIIAIHSKDVKGQRAIIVSGIIVVLSLIPWHIRQYYEYGKLMLLTPARTAQVFKTDDVENFRDKRKRDGKFYSYEEIVTKKHSIHLDTSVFTHSKYDSIKQSYNSFEGINKYISRLKGFFTLYSSDYHLGYGGDIRLYPPQFVTTRVFVLGPMMVLMFFGIFFSIYKRNYFFLAVTIAVLVHILIHMYIHYYWRYRLPITPAIFLLGWYGIQQIINQLPIKWLSPFKREDAT